MALFGPRQIADNLASLNAVSDVLNMTDVGNINEITFYVQANGVVSAGAIQIEEASHPDYTGEWSPSATALTVVSSAQRTVKVTGVSGAMRARVSVAVVGSTVDIYAVGR